MRHIYVHAPLRARVLKTARQVSSCAIIRMRWSRHARIPHGSPAVNVSHAHLQCRPGDTLIRVRPSPPSSRTRTTQNLSPPPSLLPANAAAHAPRHARRRNCTRPRASTTTSRALGGARLIARLSPPAATAAASHPPSTTRQVRHVERRTRIGRWIERCPHERCAARAATGARGSHRASRQSEDSLKDSA